MRYNKFDVVRKILDTAQTFHYRSKNGFVVATKQGTLFTILILPETIEVHYKGGVVAVCDGTQEEQIYQLYQAFHELIEEVQSNEKILQL